LAILLIGDDECDLMLVAIDIHFCLLNCCLELIKNKQKKKEEEN
jgi:hypothetical protein